MSVITYDLVSPINIDDKKVSSLKFDLDKIDGNTLIRVSRQNGSGHFAQISSPDSLMDLAAVATGLKVEDLHTLKGPDAIETMAIVNGFLNNTLGQTIYAKQLEKSEKSVQHLQ